MSDEEKKAIIKLSSKKNETTWDDIIRQIKRDEIKDVVVTRQKYITIVLNLIEKQSKEIEGLKEDRKSYAEEYIHNNPWLYKQLNEVYILRKEAEQKEKEAYRKGTNDTHKLLNKMWEDKIIAKVIEVKDRPVKDEFITATQGKLDTIIDIESLLGKE